MELHQIKYFMAMSRELNFTRAAERCGITQPAMTRAIHKLEKDLGGPLFRREGRLTHLTELGRIVRPRFEDILALTEIAQEEALDFAKLQKTKLDLGCMCTIAPTCLISLIEVFTTNAPQLNLIIHDGPGREVASKLLNGEIDAAITALPTIPDEFSAHELFQERYVVAFPKNHRFREMHAVPVAELSGEQYLSRINCEYLDVFHAAGFEGGIDTDDRFETEHESWVQAMVVAGLGCAIMPEGLAQNPEMHTRPLVDPQVCRTISIVTRRGRKHAPATDFFVRLCKKNQWRNPPF
ncbi:LysR family transcriptional regulator [uncultured Roseobacter sp.]|uniref:LysR family transcriptional regulator n=1 Tax=uncultured Roseobacter sp. TaxID=114847 RepID=UPI0026107FE6|nr:LysR family transcriptional regulator [uncultured Roseobacter sp.]